MIDRKTDACAGAEPKKINIFYEQNLGIIIPGLNFKKG